MTLEGAAPTTDAVLMDARAESTFPAPRVGKPLRWESQPRLGACRKKGSRGGCLAPHFVKDAWWPVVDCDASNLPDQIAGT